GMENTTRLKEYFKWGQSFSARLQLEPAVKFRYQPHYLDRGNADAVRACMEYYDIKNDCLIVGGDNIFDLDLEALVEFHRRKEALMSICLKEVEDVSQYGVADLDGEMRIKRFVEKPEPGTEPSRMANIGLYMLSPGIREVFSEMGERVADFGYDVPYLTDSGYPLYGYCTDRYWNDIGTPSRYLDSTLDILERKVENIRFPRQLHYRDDIWIHSTTVERIGEALESGKIDVGEHTLIGGDCSIEEGVRIAHSAVGDNCIIGEGSSITHSVVMDFVNIGKNVRLNGCIVGTYSRIEDESVIDSDLEVEFEGYGDRTPVVGENVTIFRGSVIGPKKRVVAPIEESHQILKSGRYQELGYDSRNFYFTEK
ncbi:MAG: NDP-sugar synthase, partial [Euryarchaeota archaeon]|nr:NDP-sugar synthase [Euryarchaeota archaeon]